MISLNADNLAKNPNDYFKHAGITPGNFKDLEEYEWEIIPLGVPFVLIPNLERFPTPHHFLSDLGDRLMNYGIGADLDQGLENNDGKTIIVTRLNFISEKDGREYSVQCRHGLWFLYREKKESME